MTFGSLNGPPLNSGEVGLPGTVLFSYAQDINSPQLFWDSVWLVMLSPSTHAKTTEEKQITLRRHEFYFWISIWWKDGCKLTENDVELIHWHIFLATIENIWRKQLLLASLWIHQNCYHTGHFKKWDKHPNFHIPGIPSNQTFLVLKKWQKKLVYPVQLPALTPIFHPYSPPKRATSFLGIIDSFEQEHEGNDWPPHFHGVHWCNRS